MTSAEQALRQKRDAKAIPHLQQYAPVWLVDDKLIPKEDAIQFNVVFQHHQYGGWVNRRYRYDAFNDTLYYKGQVPVSEEEVLEIQDKAPYVTATVVDIPNAYGG